MQPVIFLMGPTASGKTDIAAYLSDYLPIELISVDAAQVYRQMDIGTAKPDAEFLNKNPHHLIDVRNPDSSYSAADFIVDAQALIVDIHARNKIPLLVGGTMFYFNALEQGISPLPSSDPLQRQSLADELSDKGLAALHQELSSIDPKMAAKIRPQDTQRVLRALEIFRLTGQPPSQLLGQAKAFEYPLLKVTLFDPDRRQLHQRIHQRFHQMLANGLVQEVEALIQHWPGIENCASMRTVGYKQAVAYIRGDTNLEQMAENAIAATRQLAKRQLTWLRQQRGLLWMDATAPSTGSNLVNYAATWCNSVNPELFPTEEIRYGL